MFSVPEFHPLLNFEFIRCDLRRCCVEFESAVQDLATDVQNHCAGPECQLLEEDLRDVQVNLRWLRQRIRTFQPLCTTARKDWDSMAENVICELRMLQSRAEQIRETVGEFSPSDKQSCVEESEDRQSENTDSNGNGAESCEDQLCCC